MLTFLSHSAEAENRPKSAHRYNVAEQQQIYKSEIERIWKAQYDSLSRKDEPELTQEDVERDKKSTNDARASSRRQSVPHGTVSMYTPAQSPTAHRDTPGPSSPTFSRGSSLARERDPSMGPEAQRKVMRIKRLVNGEWKIEIIRDAAVINAYVKRRQAIEEEGLTADVLAPTGDADKDRRAKKRCVVWNSANGIAFMGVFSLSVVLFQAGRRDCENEEEPGAAVTQEECQDCQGGWHAYAIKSSK